MYIAYHMRNMTVAISEDTWEASKRKQAIKELCYSSARVHNF